MGIVGSPANFLDVISEYGGGAPHQLSEYNRGGGLVANHENNASISTTDSGLALSQFAGTSAQFRSDTYTSELGSEGYTTTPFGPRSFIATQTVSGVYGTMGSINLIGKSPSNLDQAEIVQIFDYYSGYGASPFNYSFTRFSVAGNHVNWSWDYISANGTTVYRSGSTSPAGLYTSFLDFTYWEWYTPFGFTNGGNYSIVLSL